MNRSGYSGAPLPNSWQALHELLDSQVDAVLGPLMPTLTNDAARVQWHKGLAGIEPAESPGINSVMVHYAETREWPLMNPRQAALSYLRVDSALLCLSIVRCKELSVSGFLFPPVPASTPLRQVLLFLLVDWWQHCGREQWLGYISQGCK